MIHKNIPTRITDDKGRKGILVEKESPYRKAWFHRGIPRWNPDTYGEVGQNLLAELVEREKLDFVKIVIFGYGSYILELEDLLSFYAENMKTKDVIFGRDRYLFPLSICKKEKI